jgi:carboxyl-terminal processing protease
MEILSINDIPIEQVVNNRIGKCISNIDIEVKNYALRQLLAGTYLKQRVIVVKQNSNITTINLDKASGNIADTYKYNSLVQCKTLDNNIGYIKFNNSLGETDLIQLFDSALYQLKNTKALIIDLRETPSGGNAIVARAISRFETTQTAIPYSFPTEQLYHVNGTPREFFTPKYLIDLTNSTDLTAFIKM